MWAEDDLPTYSAYEPACAFRGAGAAACGAVEVRCDQAIGEGPPEGLANQQQLPFQFVMTNKQISTMKEGVRGAVR